MRRSGHSDRVHKRRVERERLKKERRKANIQRSNRPKRISNKGPVRVHSVESTRSDKSGFDLGAFGGKPTEQETAGKPASSQPSSATFNRSAWGMKNV